jgi:putative tricarboxylic transport membrane protein
MSVNRALRGAAALLACGFVTAGLGACSSANDSTASDSKGSYPSGRISIMAPADPGGGWDQTARALQDTIRKGKLGSAEVYNVPGAGGTIGLNQLVSKRSGDTNQLMVMGLVMLGAIEQNNAPVGLDKVTPIASLTSEAEAIVVPAKSKYQSLEQLVTDVKANPTKVSFAGGSAGGSDHLLVGLLTKAARADPSKIKYVAYSGGGEAKAAILSGSVDAGVSGVGEFADQVKAGKMRVLAVSSDQPTTVGDTQAPTIKDAGYDVVRTNWRGIVAPPGISDSDREAIVAWVDKVHASPEWRANLERFGWSDYFRAGSDFDKLIQSETGRVQGIVDDLGLAS